MEEKRNASKREETIQYIIAAAKRMTPEQQAELLKVIKEKAS